MASLALDLKYLAALTERVRGELVVELSGEEAQSTRTILKKTLPAEIYAYNEWTGLVSLPEILAAFVTPNLHVVERLLTRTAELLGTRTGSTALDAYQSKSRRRVFGYQPRRGKH